MSEKMREALIAYIEAGVGNSTDYEKQADARSLAMEALAAKPAEGEAVARQYYYRVSDCPAKQATDPNCICWHDSGTGPCKTTREADMDSFSAYLEWRDKPAPPAPSVPDAWREVAEHLRYCRDCAESDISKCFDGAELWNRAASPEVKP